MTQPELFTQRTAGHLVFEEPVLTVARRHDPLPPFAASSETSRDAAIKKHDRNNSRSQREQILVFIAAQGAHGATREEISKHCDMKIQTVCPRVNELLGKAENFRTPRIVIKTGDRRKTESGMTAAVLIQHD